MGQSGYSNEALHTHSLLPKTDKVLWLIVMPDKNSLALSANRLLAIADVHGEYKELRRVIDEIAPCSSDTIVMLGDYVDHGPDSKAVIDLLIELQGICNLIPLIGNHEEMMLDARDDMNALSRWCEAGGYATLYSYSSSGDMASIPESHFQFLESCLPYYETQSQIFVHANFDWTLLMPHQHGNLLRWISIEESPPKPHISGKQVICGH